MEAMIKCNPNVTDFRYVEAGSDLLVPYGTRPCWLCRIRLLTVNRLMQLRTAAHTGGCFLVSMYGEGASPYASRVTAMAGLKNLGRQEDWAV